MTLREILAAKGRQVYTIRPSATLADVVRELVERNCGALVVCESDSGKEPGRMVGIISERDILRALAAGHALDRQAVGETMSSTLVVGNPGTSVEEAMGLMTQRRVRHLPIIEDDNLVGMVSIGDLVKSQHDQVTIENHYLKTYIQSC